MRPNEHLITRNPPTEHRLDEINYGDTVQFWSINLMYNRCSGHVWSEFSYGIHMSGWNIYYYL